MKLPVRSKPEIVSSIDKFIYVNENAISKDICEEIREYLDTNTGTHRRGSKTPEKVNAGFLTTLFHDDSHIV